MSRISQAAIFEKCPRLVTHLTGLSKLSAKFTLDTSILHLVRMRASQLNHCGFCQHMHAQEARADGELQARLDVLPAWRELDCFTPTERAALAWTEALTLVQQSPISEQIYNEAVGVLGEQNLLELTTVILEINSWNRIAVSFGFQPDIK